MQRICLKMLLKNENPKAKRMCKNDKRNEKRNMQNCENIVELRKSRKSAEFL